MSSLPTLIIRNARICTMNPLRPWAQALAISGNRIAWLGDDNDVPNGSGARVIDAEKRLLLPGLIDSHYHLLLGARRLSGLRFDGTETLPDCLNRLRLFAQQNPAADWIRVHGWSYRMFGGQPIHRHLLDEIVPDRPVYAVAFDGHTAWVNTPALERAGILGGATVGANSTVVLDADGSATGELREFDAMNLVGNIVPPLTHAEEDTLLRLALRQAAVSGITSIHNMDGDPDQIARYAALAESGELTLRIYCPMSLTPATTPTVLDELAAVAKQYTGKMVRGGCVKLFMDGVVEAKTALMLAPYADGSGELGAANYDQQQFESLVLQADRLGLQVFTHAIGDGAVQRTLDAYEAARRANGPRDARHRLEHIEVIDAADLPRLAALGVLASMQPLHADFGYDDENPWRVLVGPERWPLGFAWRTLQEAGALLAFGSDWPVVSQDPLAGVRAVLGRPNLDGSALGGRFPDQRITLEQTIAAYTRQAAYAEFAEGHKGMLRPGALADAVLLSHDLFADEVSADAARIVLTVCDGRVVYEGEEV